MLTEPENWSAAAVYQATRIFTSTLKEKMAQRFFNQVKSFAILQIAPVLFCSVGFVSS